jgi:hypothetical protein
MAFHDWSQERLYEWRELPEAARETRREAIWLTGGKSTAASRCRRSISG